MPVTDVYYLNNERSFQVNSTDRRYSYDDGEKTRDYRNFAAMLREIVKFGG